MKRSVIFTPAGHVVVEGDPNEAAAYVEEILGVAKKTGAVYVRVGSEALQFCHVSVDALRTSIIREMQAGSGLVIPGAAMVQS